MVEHFSSSAALLNPQYRNIVAQTLMMLMAREQQGCQISSQACGVLFCELRGCSLAGFLLEQSYQKYANTVRLMPTSTRK